MLGEGGNEWDVGQHEEESQISFIFLVIHVH